MTANSNIVRMDGAGEEIRESFLRWQCLIRQIAIRNDAGRPSPGMSPTVHVPGVERPIGRIVTVLCRLPRFAVTMELRHLARRAHDPAERRAAAIQFLGERYYQGALEFSETLTASFAPDSALAARLVGARECRLDFDQFGRRYVLPSTVGRLPDDNPLREATFWHNLLFNPGLPANCTILGFEPDWGRSDADPPVR